MRMEREHNLGIGSRLLRGLVHALSLAAVDGANSIASLRLRTHRWAKLGDPVCLLSSTSLMAEFTQKAKIGNVAVQNDSTPVKHVYRPLHEAKVRLPSITPDTPNPAPLNIRLHAGDSTPLGILSYIVSPRSNLTPLRHKALFDKLSFLTLHFLFENT